MSDDLQLIEKIKSYNSYVDENIIKNAYKYASEAHKSQKRHSGDPYISHPLAVANITIRFFQTDSSSGRGIIELIEWWLLSGKILNIDLPFDADVPSGILWAFIL